MAEFVAPVYVTPDGSATLYSARYGEHYHNRNGAASQARHVFIDGTLTDVVAAPTVLEIGFGAGLNFLTSLDLAEKRQVPLSYRAYEFDPLPRAALEAVAATHPRREHPLWRAMVQAWPDAPLALSHGKTQVTLDFCDAVRAELPLAWASAIYLDGFSPAVNGELWSESFIARLARALLPGGWLATYSAAGSVRRALIAAGLKVHRRAGIAGKREHLCAQKL